MSDLYDADVLEWSEQQARLLARHAASCKSQGDFTGEPVNPRKSQSDFAELPDWANIIEEIESVGRSQFNAVQSLLVMALLHDLKLAAWPLSRDAPHWRAEARGFRRDAWRQFTPSMSGEPLGSTRRKLDVARLYADALDRLPETVDDAKSEGFARGQPPLPVPPACPVTLDELLGALSAIACAAWRPATLDAVAGAARDGAGPPAASASPGHPPGGSGNCWNQLASRSPQVCRRSTPCIRGLQAGLRSRPSWTAKARESPISSMD